MEKIYKDNKGITMVALVLTIIILIILAGISINTLVGTDGLITKAQQAKENIELAQIEEQERLNEIYRQLESEIEGTSFTDQSEGSATDDKILHGYEAFINGQLVIGRMNDYSENVQKIELSAEQTGETTINIEDGYHTDIVVDASAVYNAGYDTGYEAGVAAAMANIGGNATASDILSGKTAYVNGQPVTGNIVQRAAGGNITTYGYNSSQGKGYVYFNAGYYPVDNETYGTYVWLTKDQVKALANACGVGYNDGAAAPKTVTLKVVTSGSSSRWLSESGQGISGFYINGNSIGTGALHGDSTYTWSTTV